MAVHGGSGDELTITDNADLTVPDADWCLGMWSWHDTTINTGFPYNFSNGNFSATPSLNIFYNRASDTYRLRVVDNAGDSTATIASPVVNRAQWYLVIAQRQGTVIELHAVAKGATSTSPGRDTSISTVDAVDPSIDALLFERQSGTPTDTPNNEGAMAEFFKGNFSLSDEEVLALANGAHILSMGKALDIYLPLTADVVTQKDLIGANDAVRNASGLSTVEHPPVTPGAGAQYMSFIPAAVGIVSRRLLIGTGA